MTERAQTLRIPRANAGMAARQRPVNSLRMRLRRAQFHPVVLSAMAAGVALVLGWLHDSSQPFPRIAPVLAAYGAVLGAALIVLSAAVKRGPVALHLVLIAGVALAGAAIPSALDPASYTVGAMHSLPTEWLDQRFVEMIQQYLGDLGGLHGIVNPLFLEAANGAALSLWALAVLALSRAAGRFPASADDSRLGAYLWPSLHNPPVRTALAWSAAFATLMMMAWAAADSLFDQHSLWSRQAFALPWFAFLAAIYHLAALAQRRPPGVAVVARQIEEVPDRPAVSVRPTFERLVAEMKDEIAFTRVTPAGEPGKADRLGQTAAMLAAGHRVVWKGAADRDFYRLFSHAVQEAQDRGNATLVICPDGAGQEVERALAGVTRFFSPEITQRWCKLTVSDGRFDGHVPYDLILVEESSFHGQLVPRRAELSQSLHRTRLIVLIDFHAVDACRLQSGLAFLEDILDTRGAAVLCLALGRVGLAQQVEMLFPGEAGRSAYPFEPPANRVPTYLICWNDSNRLRQRLAAALGLPPAPLFDLSAYLSLAGAPAELDSAALLDSMVNAARDFDQMRGALHTLSAWDDEARAGRSQRLTHYAPARPVRVSVVQDRGNLADVIDGRYDFHLEPDDRLLHIISEPHPARDFAVAWLEADKAFATMADPFAQKPGIGLTELAVRVENSLVEGGVDESELRRLLRSASGDLRQDLALNETMAGLRRLFGAFLPALPDIRSETDADQTHRFRLDARSRVSTLAEAAAVVTRDEQTIARLSFGDEGLIFTRDSNVFLNNRNYKIDSIDQILGRITVSDGIDGARTRNLFRRQYRIDLGKVAREQEDLKDGGDLQVTRMHIFATIRRIAHDHLEWPLDEPLLATGVAVLPAAVATEPRTRPFRSVLLLAIRGRDDAQALYPPIVRRTLSASLQDTIAFLFPALAERLAVVDLGGEAPPPAGTPFDRLAFRYPLGVAENGTPESVALAMFAGVQKRPPQFGDAWQGVDLAVIEDSDHDLGVARRLYEAESWVRLLGIWKRYLVWAADGEAFAPAAGWFDAAAALKLPLFRDI